MRAVRHGPRGPPRGPLSVDGIPRRFGAMKKPRSCRSALVPVVIALASWPVPVDRQRRSPVRRRRGRAPEGPVLRRPDAPGLQVRQARHCARLRHGARAGLRRRETRRPGRRCLRSPGTVTVSPEKQQLIGIKVATVERAPGNHTLRVPGRVAPDESRVYRINSATDGWVKKMLPFTTGSLVQKDELLATFYRPGVLLGHQGLSLRPEIAGAIREERQGDPRSSSS